MYFINGERILFYKDKLKNIDGELVSAEPLTTLWDDILSNNLHKEGNVSFPKGKKPEYLIKRVFEIATDEGDLVLDSFLGSGTTIAVAQKMNRRWIGIEMGEQAYTHCKLRLDSAISNNDNSGITKAVGWQGGGGYRFYELAPTLINEDAFGEAVINPDYDADALAAAVALHEGFTYHPGADFFWKQAIGNENSYLFTTTCRSYDKGLDKAYQNIAVKKIPQMLLDRCEFGRDDYSLNIVHPPVYEDEEVEDNE